jgi:hypothetical protein
MHFRAGGLVTRLTRSAFPTPRMARQSHHFCMTDSSGRFVLGAVCRQGLQHADKQVTAIHMRSYGPELCMHQQICFNLICLLQRSSSHCLIMLAY